MRLILTTILALSLTAPVALAAEPTIAKPSDGKTTGATPVSRQTVGEQAIADCKKMWDAGTHMSKSDWATTCRRVQDRLQSVDGK